MDAMWEVLEAQKPDWGDMRLAKSRLNSHGTEGGASALVEVGVDGGEDRMLAAKALVPAILVDLEVLGVDLVEEAAVSDMELVRRDTNDGAFETSISCEDGEVVRGAIEFLHTV